MDASIGQQVVLVTGNRTFDATVTRVYGDERSCVDLGYVDEAYVDPLPDPVPDGWTPREPRKERVNVTAAPHASSAGDSPSSWRVTSPEPTRAPKEKAPVDEPAGSPA
jgi:hypothetical protein